MKRILCPTDFSQNAQNALQYAIDLAKVFHSTIHLFHTYLVHSTAEMLIAMERYVQEGAEQLMQEQLQWIDKQWPDHPPVEYQIIKGNAIPLIAGKADHYDLVIMGTQGASNLKNIFLGSTTNGVCKNTETPVLAIPDEAKYRPLDNIILAVDDLEVTEKKVLMPLIELAKKYKSKIKIFHTELGPDDLGVDPTIDIYLSGLNYDFHYVPASKNINQHIHDFLEDDQTDLLCMIGRKRSKLNEVFHRSVTKREVLESKIPLLILTDREFKTDF